MYLSLSNLSQQGWVNIIAKKCRTCKSTFPDQISDWSYFLSVVAVPCEPSGLALDMDCEANSAMLSWDASEGAVEYFACAQSMDGEAFYCENTAASCTIEGLKCGGVYNFSVEASNGVCNSSFSPPLQAGAGKTNWYSP